MDASAKKTDWRRGSASFLTLSFICLVIAFMLMLFMMVTNVTYVSAIAATRTDAIADSIAVYAQSYDYRYNQSQAELMRALLTTYNNIDPDVYELSTTLRFDSPLDTRGDENRIKQSMYLNGNVTIKTFYPDLMGSDTLTATASARVDSVDIFGDTIVVPADASAHAVAPPSTIPDTGTSVVE